MIQVLLRRQVWFSADRAEDRWYSKTVTLPVIPWPGGEIVVGDGVYHVRTMRCTAGQAVVTVVLDSLVHSYHGSRFASKLNKMVLDGFIMTKGKTSDDEPEVV